MTFLASIAGVIALFVYFAIKESKRVAAMSPEERRLHMEQLNLQKENLTHGPINSAMICQHCQSKGKVRTKAVDRKKGISGGKATAALLTGGVSMLATGLSRKEGATRAHCGACGNGWDF